MSFCRIRAVPPIILEVSTRCFSSGSIKSAGGGIAKRGEVNEEQYFRKMREEQLKLLQESKISEDEFVKQQIDKHQSAILYHRKMIEGYLTGEKLDQIKKDYQEFAILDDKPEK